MKDTLKIDVAIMETKDEFDFVAFKQETIKKKTYLEASQLMRNDNPGLTHLSLDNSTLNTTALT